MIETRREDVRWGREVLSKILYILWFVAI